MARVARRLVAPIAVVLGVMLAVPAGASGGAAGGGAHGRALTNRDAILTAPADSVTRLLSPVQGCQVLLDAGKGDCAVVPRTDGGLVFTIEPGRRIDRVLVTRPWTVRVYRRSATVPDGWEVALTTRPTASAPGPLYANVAAKIADVTGDHTPELLLGYRVEGTGQMLDLDIVGTDADGTPRVLAHEYLDHGIAVVRQGHLVTYTPVYRTHDANCCPTWIERDTVRYRDGAFRVERGARTPTRRAKVPPSDVG